MTTLTMICATAFPKAFNDAPGANEIGTFLIYIFFAVIGAPASIVGILTQAPVLLNSDSPSQRISILLRS